MEKYLLWSKSKSDLKQREINPDIFQSYLLDSLWQNLQNAVNKEHANPLIQSSQPHTSNSVQNPPVVPHPPIPMAARFAPLALPVVLHDLPQNYSQRIFLFDGEGKFTAKQHMDRFDDFIDLEEVDYDDAKMRLFAQILTGKLRGGLRIFLQGMLLLLNPFKIFL